MRFGRNAGFAMALALAGLAVFAAGALSAPVPAWKLLAVTGPTNLPPKQSEIQRVTVEADGGDFRLGQNIVGQGTLGFASGFFTLTEGSNQLVLVFGAIANFKPGMAASGLGIPAGTTITAVSGSIVELSNASTRSGPGLVSAASKEVTGVSASAGEFHAGALISGTGIPAGTTIVSVGSGTLTLSEYPTQGGAVQLEATELTPALPYDAAAADIQAALEALPAIGAGGVSVSGGPGGDAENPWFVEFGGSNALKDVAQLISDSSSLTGENATAYVRTVLPGGNGTGEIAVYAANIGGADTAGTVTMEIGPLPPGVVTAGAGEGNNWSCPGGSGETTVTCTSTRPVEATSLAKAIRLPVEVESALAETASAEVTVSGGGAGSASIEMPIVISPKPAAPGVQAFWGGAFDEEGNPSTQAGGHPASALTDFQLNTMRARSGEIIAVTEPRDVIVDLPPGFLGNPLVTARCPQSYLVPIDPLVGDPACGAQAKIGTFGPVLGRFGEAALGPTDFYNGVPAQGVAAQFTTKVGFPVQSLLGSVRSSEDFGVRITAPNNPTYLRILGSFAALEGAPAAANGKAFLTNPTACAEEAREAPVVTASFDSYQAVGDYYAPAEQELPPVTGCDKLEFTPTFSFQPTSTAGSAPTGAIARIHISQDGLLDPDELAPPNLKQVEVKLPAGLVVNPSSANGLESCSEAQIGYRGNDFSLPNPIRFDEAAPACPDGAKLGTAEIKTPLLENPLQGTVYLAAQGDNPFGSLLALYLVVNDARTGVILKIPGEIKLDPSSGQTTAIFDHNPQLPFEDLTLNFRGGGPRAILATPEICGDYKTTGNLTPWSAPESGPPAQVDEAGFTVNSGCSTSAAARPFAPSFEAGTAGTKAGAYSPLVIKVNRNDGEQELTSLDFTLPKGLIGKLAGIPYCSEAEIAAAAGKSGRAELAAPSCPAASQLGSVDTAAGFGSEPVHVGGHVYLAGPYKGAPISSVVVTPAVAGPYRPRQRGRPGAALRQSRKRPADGQIGPDPDDPQGHPAEAAVGGDQRRSPRLHPQPDQLRTDDGRGLARREQRRHGGPDHPLPGRQLLGPEVRPEAEAGAEGRDEAQQQPGSDRHPDAAGRPGRDRPGLGRASPLRVPRPEPHQDDLHAGAVRRRGLPQGRDLRRSRSDHPAPGPAAARPGLPALLQQQAAGPGGRSEGPRLAADRDRSRRADRLRQRRHPQQLRTVARRADLQVRPAHAGRQEGAPGQLHRCLPRDPQGDREDDRPERQAGNQQAAASGPVQEVQAEGEGERALVAERAPCGLVGSLLR